MVPYGYSFLAKLYCGSFDIKKKKKEYTLNWLIDYYESDITAIYLMFYCWSIILLIHKIKFFMQILKCNSAPHVYCVKWSESIFKFSLDNDRSILCLMTICRSKSNWNYYDGQFCTGRSISPDIFLESFAWNFVIYQEHRQQ